MGCLLLSLIIGGVFTIGAGLVGIILGAIGVEGYMSTGVAMVIAGIALLVAAVAVLKVS